MIDDFKKVLAEFGRMNGHDLALDEEGACDFDVDNAVIVNLRALEQSGQIVAWATIGELPEDDLAGARAAYLLTINDLGVGTHGFTLGMDEDERRLVVHDRRKADVFVTVNELAAWVDDLVETVSRIRREFEARFPIDDEDDLPDDPPSIVSVD